jgi:DNA-binding winged helix-turn-helix (wHTH) protein
VPIYSLLCYEFGPFHLLPSERLLLRENAVVHLPPKVFDTLVVLVRHSGRLLSKRELLDLIWPDTVVEENNLTQAICAIRKALGWTGQSREYVETVPKQGYRFVAPVRTTDGDLATRTLADLATERPSLGMPSSQSVPDFQEGALKGKARPVWFHWNTATVLVIGLFMFAVAEARFRTQFWAPRHDSPPYAPVARSHTAPILAYQDYLDGMGALERRTDPSLRAAIFYFERAIERDSAYALAYAALADCYVLLGLYNISSQDALSKAQPAASKAAALDSSSGEAHTALAAIRAFYQWDWAGARREFERALELNPEYPLAHHWYAIAYWIPMGRNDQALAQLRRARQLNPQSSIIQTDVGWVYYVMRHYDQAIAEYDSVVGRDGSVVPALYDLSLAYEKEARYQQALTALSDARAANTTRSRSSSVATVSEPTGYRKALLSMSPPISPFAVTDAGLYAGATVYMRLGDPERALSWLQKAYRHHDPGLVYMTADPVFDALRADPRFQEVAQRVGLAR